MESSNQLMKREPVILLVDDNPGDIHLTQEAFRENGHRPHFLIADSGTDALGVLRKEGAHGTAPTPDFILLDLNLPRMDGRELLRLIKGDEQLRRIPTVILTTSNRRQDIEQCYGLFANTYIVKPVHWDQFLKIVKSLEHYWFNVAALPAT